MLRPLKSDHGTRSGDKESTDRGAASPRAGTKQALVIEMLCAKKGATLDALIERDGLAAAYDARGSDGAAQTGLLD